MTAKIHPIADGARPSDAGPFLSLMQAAIARGAVAAMIVFELPDGSTERLTHPDYGCVTRGLTKAALIIDGAEEV